MRMRARARIVGWKVALLVFKTRGVKGGGCVYLIESGLVI
jgi:hypothetical protein